MSKKLLEKNQLINSRYQIVSEINEGASGQVFIVIDRNTKNKTKKALKIIPASNEKTNNEVDILSRLTLADNIAKILDFGTIDLNGKYSTYIVMDYYELGEISNLASDKDFQLFSSKELIYYLKQSLWALRNLHSNDNPIIHKDVKPGNILIDKSKTAYLSDFGISAFAQDLKQDTKVNGTAKYMAPESRYSMVDSDITRTFGLDIFALGVIFYRFATGVMPQIDYGINIKNDSERDKKKLKIEKNYSILDTTIWEEIPEPKVLNSGLDDDLNRIISKMIMKDQNKRYKNVDSILKDINSLENGKKVKSINMNINDIPVNSDFKSVEKKFYVYRIRNFIKIFNGWWFLLVTLITILIVFIFVVVILFV